MFRVILTALLIVGCGTVVGSRVASVVDSRPIVYNYSGDFCQPCKVQTRNWVNYLGGVDSSKVKIKTLVIDLQPNRIPGYVASLGIPWETVSDLSNNYRKYCSGVPCNVVVVNGKIVYAQAGGVHPNTLEQKTGGWK